MAEATAQQQHSIGLYLKVWLLLFVLSAGSYMVDYFQLQGYLRWSLVLIFMILKAGLIISVFMHFAWERTALKLVLLMPMIFIVGLTITMALEGEYIHALRLMFYSQGDSGE